jgi:hypothetical protein
MLPSLIRVAPYYRGPCRTGQGDRRAMQEPPPFAPGPPSLTCAEAGRVVRGTPRTTDRGGARAWPRGAEPGIAGGRTLRDRRVVEAARQRRGGRVRVGMTSLTEQRRDQDEIASIPQNGHLLMTAVRRRPTAWAVRCPGWAAGRNDRAAQTPTSELPGPALEALCELRRGATSRATASQTARGGGARTSSGTTGQAGHLRNRTRLRDGGAAGRGHAADSRNFSKTLRSTGWGVRHRVRYESRKGSQFFQPLTASVFCSSSPMVARGLRPVAFQPPGLA